MKENLLIYLKGVLMGICDLIPGISGGTIAFVTGIYERLISSVKSIFSFLPFFTHKAKAPLKASVFFLAVLFAGIFTAILLGSHTISYLLNTYPIATLSFFSGLILASSSIIFRKIEDHGKKNILFGLVGLIIGIIFSFVSPLSATPTLPYIFLGGFLAISAMFLPGISGAFVLLILGLYDHMIFAINDFSNNLSDLVVFGVGAVCGAAVISKSITYLFSKDRCKTLYVLLGLVLGALLLPIRRVVSSAEVWDANLVLYAALFFLIGLSVVFLSLRIERK